MRDVMKSIAEAATGLPLNGGGRPSDRWAGPQPQRESDEAKKDRETHDRCGEALEEGDVGEKNDDEGRRAGIQAPEDQVVRPPKQRRAVSSESDEEREVQVRHHADKERVIESDRYRRRHLAEVLVDVQHEQREDQVDDRTDVQDQEGHGDSRITCAAGARPTRAHGRPADKRDDGDEDRCAECGPSDEAPAPETSDIERDAPRERDDQAASEPFVRRSRACATEDPKTRGRDTQSDPAERAGVNVRKQDVALECPEHLRAVCDADQDGDDENAHRDLKKPPDLRAVPQRPHISSLSALASRERPPARSQAVNCESLTVWRPASTPSRRARAGGGRTVRGCPSWHRGRTTSAPRPSARAGG